MRETTIIEPPSLADLNPIRGFRRLVRSGDLLRTLTMHRLRVRYKQTRLGIAWAVVQPLAIMLVFTLVFRVLGRGPGGDLPYPLFFYSALVPWVAFSSGLSNAASSLTGHASLLTKVSFPREIIPLTYVLAALVDMAFASIALVALMVAYGVAPGIAIVWAVPAVALLAGFLTGAGLLLSTMQVGSRDIGVAMPVLLQVWMFATPVIYPLEAVRQALPRPVYLGYILNPMAGIVETFRRAVVLDELPPFDAILSAAIVTLVLLPAAYLFFKSRERTMADAV